MHQIRVTALQIRTEDNVVMSSRNVAKLYTHMYIFILYQRA